MSNSSVLLLDCSGSMGQKIRGVRKIDSLRIACSSLKGYKRVAFNNSVFNDQVPDPSGDTHMVMAFHAMQEVECQRIILISDGMTSDGKSETLAAAKALGKPIDIIFIGNDDEGEMFMESLAEATGGRHVTIHETLQLSQAIRQHVAMLSGATP